MRIFDDSEVDFEPTQEPRVFSDEDVDLAPQKAPRVFDDSEVDVPTASRKPKPASVASTIEPAVAHGGPSPIKPKIQTQSAIGKPNTAGDPNAPGAADFALGVAKALPATFTSTFRKTGTILKKYPWLSPAIAMTPGGGEAVEAYYQKGEEALAPKNQADQAGQIIGGIPAAAAKYAIPHALIADLGVGGTERIIRAKEGGASTLRATAATVPEVALALATARFGGDSGARIMKAWEMPNASWGDIARVLSIELGKNVSAGTVQTVANNLSERYSGADPNRKAGEGLGQNLLTQGVFMMHGAGQARGEFARSLAATKARRDAIAKMRYGDVPAPKVGSLETRFVPRDSRRADLWEYLTTEKPKNTVEVPVDTTPTPAPRASRVARPPLTDMYESARTNIQADDIAAAHAEYAARNQNVQWKVDQLEAKLAKKGKLSKPDMKRLTELRNSLNEDRLGVVNREGAAREDAIRRLDDTDLSDWLGYTPERPSNTADMIAATIGRTPNFEARFGQKSPGTTLLEYLAAKRREAEALPYVKPKPTEAGNLDLPSPKVNPAYDFVIRPTRREDVSPQFEEARKPLRAAQLTGEQYQVSHGDPRRHLEGLDRPELEAIGHMMQQGQQRKVPFTEAQAAELGVSPQGFKAYRAFVDDYRAQAEQNRAAAKQRYEETGDAKYKTEFDKWENALLNNPEYIPRNRPGDLQIAYKKDGKTIGIVTGKNRLDVLEAAERAEAMDPTLAPHRQGIARWQTDKTSGATGSSAAKHLQQAENLPGADLDFVRSHFEYTRGMGKRYAQTLFGDQVQANLDKLYELSGKPGAFGDKAAERLKDGTAQAARALKAEWEWLKGDKTHPLVKKIGKFTTLSLMGGDPAQFAIQPFQLVSHADPTFTADFGRAEGGPALRRGIAIGAKLQAQKAISAAKRQQGNPWEALDESDVAGYAPKGTQPKQLLADLHAANKVWHEEGILQDVDKAVYMNRLPEPTRTDLGKLASEAGEWLMFPMKFGEYTNRASTANGAYLQYRKAGKSHAEAMDLAARMSDRINNVSGEGNMSHLHRVLGGAGTIPTRLKGFGPQYVELMLRNARTSKARLLKEGKSPAAATVGSLLPAIESMTILGMVAGYKAVPFITDAWEGLRILQGSAGTVGLDQEIEEALAKRKMPTQVKMAARMGIFSLLGVDPSSRLGFDRILGIQASDAGRSRGLGKTIGAMLLGASQSNLDKIDKAERAWVTGDTAKIGEAILPRGIANMGTAAEGQASVGGAKRPMTEGERLTKGFGFQPVSIAQEQFKARILKAGQDAGSAARRRFANAIVDGGNVQDVYAQVHAYNAEQIADGRPQNVIKISSVRRAAKAIKSGPLKLLTKQKKADAILKLMEEAE